MSHIDYDDAMKRSRDIPAFSNGTEIMGWQDNWCDRCAVDAPFRNGISPRGCPLIMVALMSRTPAEWLDGPVDEQGRYSIADQYHCVEFRAQGGGSGGEPKPRPTPRGQGQLFDRPAESRRILTSEPSPSLVGVDR